MSGSDAQCPSKRTPGFWLLALPKQPDQAFCHGTLWQGQYMSLLELCHSLQYGDPAALETLAPVFGPSSRLLEKTLQELSLQPSRCHPPLLISLHTPSRFTKGTLGDSGGGAAGWTIPGGKEHASKRQVSRHQEVGR